MNRGKNHSSKYTAPYTKITKKDDWRRGFKEAVKKLVGELDLTIKEKAEVLELEKFILNNVKKFSARSRVTLASAIVYLVYSDMFDGEEKKTTELLKKLPSSRVSVINAGNEIRELYEEEVL